MNGQTVFCPGGASSQTGTAARERYGTITIQDCGKIPDVPPLLESNPGPFVIPIWNSHEGEITKAEYVWDHIEESKIKISDAWAKRIEFWFLRKKAQGRAKIGKIGSVGVAATQCSGFFKKQRAELQPFALTTVAYDAYNGGEVLDGVLVAPNHPGITDEYEIVSRATANPNNFTSFVRFVPSRAFTGTTPTSSWLTGVTMRPFDSFLRDTEQSFFEQLLSSVTDLSKCPKLIFVLKRTAKVALLFEGVKLFASDLLTADEQEQSDISVFEEAGATAKMYTAELQGLFEDHFPSLCKNDFVIHRGVNSCLFACPSLGLFTHGYQVETVEPVVRFYISKLFDLWDQGAKCTPEQSKFFNRHHKAWQKKGSEFIKFKRISATG